MSKALGKNRERQGHCLCGAVKIVARQAGRELAACHCRMCRRWGGGPFMEIDCGTEVAIAGEQNITVYNSSDWAERAFCKKCGTNLFYRLKEAQQHIVSSEIFNEVELNFDHQIFIDEKPNYYVFSNETKNMTGAEVFAAYAPKE